MNERQHVDDGTQCAAVLGESHCLREHVVVDRRLRGAVARLLTEDHLDWRDALECDLAQMLGVAPGDEPFTWRWADHVGEGL